MNIDLSLIDKVDRDTQGRKAGRFAPRSKTRPGLREAKGQAEADGFPAEDPTPSSPRQPPPEIINDAVPAQAASPSKAGPGSSQQPFENLHTTAQQIDPEREATDATVQQQQQPQKTPGPGPGTGYELPLRLRRKLRPRNTTSTQNKDEKAIIAVDSAELDETDQAPSKRRRIEGPGKSTKKKVDLEQEATVELHPGQDSIQKFVKRAQAQEKMRQAEKKREVGRVENGDEDDEQLAIQAPPEATLAFAPQLELVDGKLVPKAQSLTVQAQAEPSHRRVREYSNVVNNASYTNRAPNERWSAEETEAFYNAVSCFGANFELIAKLFPGRPRKSLANKWRRENKQNPDRINEAYRGGNSLEGLQKIVEALQQGGDVGNGDGEIELGFQATDLLEPAPESQAGAIVPAKSNKSSKSSKAAKSNSKSRQTAVSSMKQANGAKISKDTSKRSEAAAKRPKGKRGKARAHSKFDRTDEDDEEIAEGLLQMAKGPQKPARRISGKSQGPGERKFRTLQRGRKARQKPFSDADLGLSVDEA